MKKGIKKEQASVLIEMAVIICFIMIGCNSGNDKEATTSSNISLADTTISNNSAMTKTDSGTANPSSLKPTDSNYKPATIKGIKKGRKGRVSISPITAPDKNNSTMSMDKEGYYLNSDVLPSFPGGQNALENYFEKNIEYPQDASDNGIEGVVNISFAVDEKGKISQAHITNTPLGYGIEEEAMRVFNKMPKWAAGSIKGKNVKTRYSLPVRFQLAD